jgi:glycosyltransferase involved in cell wall biosynthesis
VSPEEAPFVPPLDEAGFTFRQIPELGRRIRIGDDLRAWIALVRLVFMYQPDIVHTHTAKAGVLGRLAALVFNLTRRREKRCAIVHTFHGHVLDQYFGKLTSVAIRLTERILASFTDHIVVISSRQRHDIQTRFRIAAARKIHVIPLGLELDPLLSLKCQKPTIGITFGYVGRFAPVKNLPLLLRAFAQSVESGCIARLVLVGGGELRSQLAQLSVDLGISEYVEFADWQTDLLSIYQKLDAVVLTSRSEGTPVALIEAMACGLPVISTSVGGVPDIVRDGETGLLVPSDDVDQLSAALSKLARDPAFRRQLGNAARADVARRFRSERLISDVHHLYTASIRRKRGKKACENYDTAESGFRSI